MAPVIQVEGVGKRYYVGHQRVARDASLRDAISDAARLLGQRLLHPLLASSGQPLPGEPGTEEFWALRDISFTVEAGERIGIIGRNGAGKSTLLKILSRITEPTVGRVRLRGRTSSLLEVGTGFHPELTGRENIFLNGAILGMRRAEIRRKFDEIVTFAEVEKFLDTPVKRYSSGMYVRLAFAVAAHLEPDILIVDEVLAVGDAQFQRKCLGKIEEVSTRQGRTVLFVSHNMPAVQRLCGKTLLMEHGGVVGCGASSEVISRYLQADRSVQLHWQRSAGMEQATAQILEVTVVDERDQPATYVATGGNLRVRIVFEIERANPLRQLSLALLDENGSVICDTTPLDCGIQVAQAQGICSATVVFPKDLLLPKPYGVRAMLWKLREGVEDCVEHLRFTAAETESLGNSNPGGRPGLVAVQCSWQLNSRY